jgi:hypothetical protein
MDPTAQEPKCPKYVRGLRQRNGLPDQTLYNNGPKLIHSTISFQTHCTKLDPSLELLVKFL